MVGDRFDKVGDRFSKMVPIAVASSKLLDTLFIDMR